MGAPESKPAADAPPVIKTISSWSFSRLTEDYEVCPLKAKFLYVDKKPRPEATKGDALLRGSRIHEGAEQYVMGQRDDLIPELAKVKPVIDTYRAAYPLGNIEVEQDWAFNRDWQQTSWFDKDTWFRLKLDVFVNNHDGTAEVLDWKSGKKFGKEVAHSQQGTLYGISAMLRYPEINQVSIKFSYVDQPRTADTSKTFSRETLMRLLPSWNSRAKAMTEATTFPAKPSKISCRYCPFSPNNNGDSSCPYGVPV
jgi:hypothetical protein